MNLIWYGWRAEWCPKLCPWNGIYTCLLLESTALSSHQCLTSGKLTFVRAESCQEQKYKQLVAVLSMLVMATWTSRKKQWEQLQDPSKFRLVQEHDVFHTLKKVNRWLSNFPHFLLRDLSPEYASEGHRICTWFCPSARLSVPKSPVVDSWTGLPLSELGDVVEALVWETQLLCPLPKDKFNPSPVNHNWMDYLKYREQVHSTYSSLWVIVALHHVFQPRGVSVRCDG